VGGPTTESCLVLLVCEPLGFAVNGCPPDPLDFTQTDNELPACAEVVLTEIFTVSPLELFVTVGVKVVPPEQPMPPKYTIGLSPKPDPAMVKVAELPATMLDGVIEVILGVSSYTTIANV
jgi:hypothetical protein